MIDFTLSPPAIIEYQEVREISFGLSYAPSHTELDRFIVPRDWHEATIDELRAYIPADIREMPEWAIRGMFPLFARKVGGKALVKTTVFLTSMSGSNQTWNVLADWNSAENIVHCIGGGGSGGGGSNGIGGGGGGGAYARKTNITLTPSGSATFRLGNRAAAGSSNGGTGSDVWFNGSSLGVASVGAKGGSGGTFGTNSGNGGTGGSAASSVGSEKYEGGNGATGSISSGFFSGGGGGAGGPNGPGGAAPGSSQTRGAGGQGGNGAGGVGGTRPGGSTPNPGGNGTEFQSSPAVGSGGGGSGINYGDYTGHGGAGGNYGGGGGGAAALGARNGGQGAQGLIVIINNHLTGV